MYGNVARHSSDLYSRNVKNVTDLMTLLHFLAQSPALRALSCTSRILLIFDIPAVSPSARQRLTSFRYPFLRNRL